MGESRTLHRRLLAGLSPVRAVRALRAARDRSGVRFLRLVTTSNGIERRIKERQAAGDQLRAHYFDGPGSEGELVAAEALRAAEDLRDPADLAAMAEIVVDAAFSPRADLESTLLAIRRVGRPDVGPTRPITSRATGELGGQVRLPRSGSDHRSTPDLDTP